MKVIAASFVFFLAGTLLGQERPVERPIVSAPGRYQIVINPNVRADTWLLDTETGRVWTHSAVSDVKGSPTVWMIEPRFDSDDEFSQWAAKQPKRPN